ncbi:MAG: hypothetical protein ACREDR_24170, partial [Blastocatellia bacterium]
MSTDYIQYDAGRQAPTKNLSTAGLFLLGITALVCASWFAGSVVRSGRSPSPTEQIGASAVTVKVLKGRTISAFDGKAVLT